MGGPRKKKSLAGFCVGTRPARPPLWAAQKLYTASTEWGRVFKWLKSSRRKCPFLVHFWQRHRWHQRHNTFIVTFRRTLRFHALSFEQSTAITKRSPPELKVETGRVSVDSFQVRKKRAPAQTRIRGIIFNLVVWKMTAFFSLALCGSKFRGDSESSRVGSEGSHLKKKWINFCFLFPIVYLSVTFVSLMQSS